MNHKSKLPWALLYTHTHFSPAQVKGFYFGLLLYKSVTAAFLAAVGVDPSLSLLFKAVCAKKFIVWALIDGPGLPFLNLLLLIKCSL